MNPPPAPSARFVHERQRPPHVIPATHELVLACPPLRSHVNLARIVRAAGCSGVRRMIVCGRPRIDAEIARDALAQVTLEPHRTLPPVLRQLKADGYQLVGLEQAQNSECSYDFEFAPRTVLVLGPEREGLVPELLALVDRVLEIPVFGRPSAHNVATAAAIAMYEYGRQLPRVPPTLDRRQAGGID